MIRMLWWNIGKSAHDRAALNAALQRLVEERRPDLLLLGEYYQDSLTSNRLEPATNRLLYRHYGAGRIFVSIQQDAKNRNAVYTRWPYRVEGSTGLCLDETGAVDLDETARVFAVPATDRRIGDRYDRTVPLDFAPLHLSEPARARWRMRWHQWTTGSHSRWHQRAFLSLRFAHPPVVVLPVHLLMGWLDLKLPLLELPFPLLPAGHAQRSGRFTFRGRQGRLPIRHQVDHLHRLIAARPGRKGDAIVMLGDFNIHYPGRSTPLIRQLQRDFRPVFKEYAVTSRPTRLPWSHSMVDLAFWRGPVRAVKAAVLPMKGSDHHPIQVVVEVSQGDRTGVMGVRPP